MGLMDGYNIRKHDYLICVDSDGCAMDTMDIKHFRCFGPCMISEWGLSEWEDEILARWNEINLYSMTRGINRFRGLAMALEEINDKYCQIEDIESLSDWVKSAPQLSNAAVSAAADKTGSVCLARALSWSKAVNEGIEALDDDTKKAFEGAAEALEKAHADADIAVVSSANPEAVASEWSRCGLLGHTDVVMAQDKGTKENCISLLLEAGYDKDHVLMVGDAPGDLDAAKTNGVMYYPILVRHEKESWQLFADEILGDFLGGNYKGKKEEEMITRFRANLS